MTVGMFQISTEYPSHIQRKRPVHHVWKGNAPSEKKEKNVKGDWTNAPSVTFKNGQIRFIRSQLSQLGTVLRFPFSAPYF